MKVAIIPARGGSKRIPRKNIKNFYGKPMIAWAINAAIKSNLFDKIIVSTDDLEISRIAIEYGAITPFIRPENLSDDLTPTVPVIAHAIEMCISYGWEVDFACCIYPGVPFLENEDLIKAFNILIDNNSSFVYPVAEFAHPIQRAMRRISNGKMDFIDSDNELTRTQDLETTYHDAGQFYWGQASAWLKHKKMHTDGLGMPIPNWRVVDIDNMEDWKRAELLTSIIKID